MTERAFPFPPLREAAEEVLRVDISPYIIRFANFAWTSHANQNRTSSAVSTGGTGGFFRERFERSPRMECLGGRMMNEFEESLLSRGPWRPTASRDTAVARRRHHRCDRTRRSGRVPGRPGFPGRPPARGFRQEDDVFRPGSSYNTPSDRGQREPCRVKDCGPDFRQPARPAQGGPAGGHRLGRLQGIYLPLVQRWLRRVPGLGNEADDLAQEVFVVVVRELPRFERRREGSFRAWLRTITANKARNY